MRSGTLGRVSCTSVAFRRERVPHGLPQIPRLDPPVTEGCKIAAMEVELLETGRFSSVSLAGIPFAMSLYVRERLRAAAAAVWHSLALTASTIPATSSRVRRSALVGWATSAVARMLRPDSSVRRSGSTSHRP